MLLESLETLDQYGDLYDDFEIPTNASEGAMSDPTIDFTIVKFKQATYEVSSTQPQWTCVDVEDPTEALFVVF